jgi:hypothetical protein
MSNQNLYSGLIAQKSGDEDGIVVFNSTTHLDAYAFNWVISEMGYNTYSISGNEDKVDSLMRHELVREAGEYYII